MEKAKKKLRPTRKLTAEEREHPGQSARRVVQAIREFEKKAGKTVADDELLTWDQMDEEERELYRKSGEAVAGGVLPSEQEMWDLLPQVRAAMGEKAFRKKMFSICIDIAVDRLAPHLSELERYKAAQAIVGLSGMLEVPPDAAGGRASR